MGYSILQVGVYIVEGYYWLILVSILGSWFPSFQSTKVGIWISKLVEPYLGIFRRFIPPFGAIDFSPIIALFVYRFLSRFALEGLRQSVNFLGV
ncbi:YggT family protein [Neobacillus sp. Marseille-QA0830]